MDGSGEAPVVAATDIARVLRIVQLEVEAVTAAEKDDLYSEEVAIELTEGAKA